MRNALIVIATLIAIAHIAVPALQSWELPGQNVASANAVVADGVGR